MHFEQFIIPDSILETYSEIISPEVIHALTAVAPFNKDIKAVMESRLKRRFLRQQNKERIQFLNEETAIPRTNIKVKDARAGNFEGAVIPHDLQRQWIQGTGPAAKPDAPIESSIRNVAYALLSGADGWMFDGEDALGQINTMSLDNQRNLKLAISKDDLFMKVAQRVAGEMNKWSIGFLEKNIIDNWEEQLNFTTKIFRARGLHLDDRHIADTNKKGFAASLVDVTL